MYEDRLATSRERGERRAQRSTRRVQRATQCESSEHQGESGLPAHHCPQRAEQCAPNHGSNDDQYWKRQSKQAQKAEQCGELLPWKSGGMTSSCARFPVLVCRSRCKALNDALNDPRLFACSDVSWARQRPACSSGKAWSLDDRPPLVVFSLSHPHIH